MACSIAAGRPRRSHVHGAPRPVAQVSAAFERFDAGFRHGLLKIWTPQPSGWSADTAGWAGTTTHLHVAAPFARVRKRKGAGRISRDPSGASGEPAGKSPPARLAGTLQGRKGPARGECSSNQDASSPSSASSSSSMGVGASISSKRVASITPFLWLNS